MPTIDVLIAFAVTTALFAFIPGPAMLYAAARTMAGGRRAGLMAVLGINIGAYVHVIAAAAGLSALFNAVPVAYTIVKLVGALYLVWLGISLFRSRETGPEPSTVAMPKSARKAFFESVAVEVLNPKTAIFFLAFLPQFVDANASLPLWAQLAILGAIVNTIFTFADVVCVFLAGLIIEKVKQSSRTQKLVQRLGGTILVGLGLHVALQRT
ncbi:MULTISPECIES: LysE family translocator [Neorhizobium]|jgi:threonine/homoserine/homoserine lactone efflux protein|uniref:LysE family translocator n=1 Tax=Neorhizobium TaxID=1525371 RepID=UPI000CF91AC7|nr:MULTISPECIES: LysE family translocator [Neorhizobium]TCV71932.1 threonine/homoserine/homoserine lactone efflux protein [Neorhizobium sp. S3-V5DH]